MRDLPQYPLPPGASDTRFTAELKKWGRKVVSALRRSRGMGDGRTTAATEDTVGVLYDTPVSVTYDSTAGTFTVTAVLYSEMYNGIGRGVSADGQPIVRSLVFDPPADADVITIGFHTGYIMGGTADPCLLWQPGAGATTSSDADTQARQLPMDWVLAQIQLNHDGTAVIGGCPPYYMNTAAYAGQTRLPYLLYYQPETKAIYFDGRAQWTCALTDNATNVLSIAGMYGESTYPDYAAGELVADSSGYDWHFVVGRIDLSSGRPTVFNDWSRQARFETIGVNQDVTVAIDGAGTLRTLRFVNGNLTNVYTPEQYTTTTTTGIDDHTTTTTTTTQPTTTTTTTTTTGEMTGYYCEWYQEFSPGRGFAAGSELGAAAYLQCVELTPSQAAQYPLYVEGAFVDVKYTLQPAGAVAQCSDCTSTTTTTTTTSTTTGADVDLRPYILERQKVAGISDAWSEASPNDPDRQISLVYSYTVSEYKDYISALITAGIANDAAYIDGVYEGGTSEPTYLTSSYAGAATTNSELYTLLVAMTDTWHPATWSSGTRWVGTANSDESWAAAKTAAEAAWGTASASSQPIQMYFTGVYSPVAPGRPKPVWTASIGHTTVAYSLSFPTTEIAKSVKLWALSNDWSGIDGYDMTFEPSSEGPAVAAGAYDEAWESSGTNTSASLVTTAAYGTASTPPGGSWCVDPQDVSGLTSWRGYSMDASATFGIAHWSFTA